jgi:hypothetical protein
MAKFEALPTDEGPLTTYLFWGALAACAVVLAVGSVVFGLTSGRAERAAQRIAIQPPAPLPMPSQAAIEAARMNETLRGLAADRDRLVARIDRLERSLGDFTASISKPVPAVPGPAPEPEAIAAPPAAATVSQTEFAVDLGGETSIEGLRALWATLRGNHAALEGLRPLIHVRDGAKSGTVELRLVAGPFANAAGAARLCAALATKRVPCQTTTFEGQRLALR